MAESEEPGEDSGAVEGGGGATIGAPTLVISAIIFALPATIPFYYATQTEKLRGVVVLVGMGLGVLLLNGMFLFLLYRWLQRYGRGLD